jgi:hypothetical protein
MKHFISTEFEIYYNADFQSENLSTSTWGDAPGYYNSDLWSEAKKKVSSFKIAMGKKKEFCNSLIKSLN